MVSLKACFSATLVLLLFRITQYQVDCASSKVHLKLLEDLKFNYTKPYMRPVIDTTEPVLVGVRYAPVFATLDAPKQELTVRAMLAVKWKDYQLQWQPEEYEGIKETTIPLFLSDNSMFWTPELSLYQSIDTDFQSFYPETHSATLTFLGEVHWYTLVTTKSYCMMKNMKFPFDKQACQLLFTTWLYQTNEQLFERIDDIVENGTYHQYEIPNALWSVEIKEPVEVGIKSYECETCKGKQQSYIRYRLELTRGHSEFYILFLGVPCFIISILMIFIPCMRGMQGVDVPSYVLTCILGLFVYLAYVQNVLPSTGPAVYAGLYIMSIIIAGIMAMVIFVFGNGLNGERTPLNDPSVEFPTPEWKEEMIRIALHNRCNLAFIGYLVVLNVIFIFSGFIIAISYKWVPRSKPPDGKSMQTGGPPDNLLFLYSNFLSTLTCNDISFCGVTIGEQETKLVQSSHNFRNPGR